MSILYAKENYLSFFLLMVHTPLQTTLEKMHEANLHHDKKKRQEVVQHLRGKDIKNALTANDFEVEKKQALEEILEAIFDVLNKDNKLKESF
jgi:hypothetical protein